MPLGVHVVPTLHPDITHHLTPTFSLNPAIATSLISLATFVKPEWLAAVIESGRAEPEEFSPLERMFILPPTSKYRPTFAPALPPRLKKFDVWQPNEERVGIFRNHRFVFAGEKGAEVQSSLKELVKRGEGEYECFAVESGVERFRQVLAKGKARALALVLVADRPAMVAAVGESVWKAFVEEARNFGVEFLAPEKVIEAVVYADISYVSSFTSTEETALDSILPDVIPNSIEDEPTFPPPRSTDAPIIEQGAPITKPEVLAEPSRHKLPQRNASRASSRGPSPGPAFLVSEPAQPSDMSQEPPQDERTQPRRTLVRRAARPKTLVGLDDTSMDIEGHLQSERTSEEPPAAVAQSSTRCTESVIPPTPARPSRLKRRVGTQAQSVGSELFPPSVDVMISDAQEPPHKKYKALFDESEPDKVAQMDLDEYASQHIHGGESITQYEPSMPPFATQKDTQRRSGRSIGMRSGATGGLSLAALMEEEEESTLASRRTMQTQTHTRGTKRKSQAIEIEGDGDIGGEAPLRTRRRIEDEPGTESPLMAEQSQAQNKPLSQIVTRVDMSQSQVHMKEKPSKKGTKGNGAAPGEPDKDNAFLKAVASTKRGKKVEDTFDREFNNLRISKPDLEWENEYEEWAVLDQFEDDVNLRGNFMVVVELPVYKETVIGDGVRRDHLRRGEGRLEWQGRPDFKKFRRKTAGERHQPVELVVEEDADLGIGSQYWKGASQAPPASQSHSHPNVQPDAESMTLRSTQRSSKSNRPVLTSEEDEGAKGSTLSRAASKPPNRRRSQASRSPTAKPRSAHTSRDTATRLASQKQPLFIDSDIEQASGNEGGDIVVSGGGLGSGSELEDILGSDGEDGLAATLRTSARGTQIPSSRSAGKRRPAPVVIDDDSDDGATFKAFGTRTRSKRR
ncbi:hypothetical protein BD414DRAFT_539100 [Trametes punicea]|nr:hypothetical protein BD414DRAFT_539100 [Trametes punicea]